MFVRNYIPHQQNFMFSEINVPCWISWMDISETKARSIQLRNQHLWRSKVISNMIIVWETFHRCTELIVCHFWRTDFKNTTLPRF